MSLNCADAKDVLKAIKDNNVQMIDLRFTDLPGTWQHAATSQASLLSWSVKYYFQKVLKNRRPSSTQHEWLVDCPSNFVTNW